MPIIIPWMFFSLLWLAFVGRSGLRQGFVYAAVVYTLCMVVATETLSAWNVLQLETLLAFWTGLTVLSALWLWWYGDRKATGQTLRGAWMGSRGSRLEISAVVLILATVLMIAVVAPPHVWESMASRMTRVMMWIQQGSVSHYPTTNFSQLFHPPLLEWNILHLQILSGGDRFANTVEWLAWVGCGVVASLIARELKQTFPVQVLATVIAVTLPMGQLQASSVNSNLAASFWLMTFALFAIQYLKGPSAGSMVRCGLSLGFALLSKGTAYPVAPPLAATLFLYGMIHAKGYRSRVRLACAAVAIVVVAIALNGGHYARNWDLFGHPVHPGVTALSHVVEEINVSVLLSNLVRNAALHWGVPSDTINNVTLGAVRRIFGDAIDTVPGTTLGRPLFQAGIPFRIHESFTGNFLHFSLLSASLCGVLLFRRRFQVSALTVFYALAVVLGAFSFCGLLAWEEWNSRYHSPLFMLGAPIVAVFVATFCSSVKLRSRFAGTGSGWIRIVAGTFLVLSIPWIVANEIRPLYAADDSSILSTDRMEMYFKDDNPAFFQDYVDAVNVIAAYRPREVGLYTDYSLYEYPIGVLFKERLTKMPRLEYVGVENKSGDLREGNAAPPFVLSDKALQFREFLEGEAYVRTYWNPKLTVLARADVATGIFEKWERNISMEWKRLIHSGDFDVYRDRKTHSLVYVKNQCRPSNLQPPDSTSRVFVHLIPVDADDLPDGRKQYGYDNLDFRFNDSNVFLRDGRCVNVRRLPDYDVAVLRTGESTHDSLLWEAEVSFDE